MVHIPVFIRRIHFYFLSLLKNCNHKGLGIYYLLSSFIFGISGTLISVLIRIELYSSGNRIISPENQNFYNINITLHGFLMIFFLVMPGLFGGFGNYFVPIFQGSPEVVYPRVNNFSILILLLSYLGVQIIKYHFFLSLLVKISMIYFYLYFLSIFIVFSFSFSFTIIAYWFSSLLSFVWIGGQFPQDNFLSYGRILTLYYYFLLICISFMITCCKRLER